MNITSSIDIAALEPEHLPLMAELEQQCFTEPWTAGMLAGELSNPHAVWWVAMCGDTLCAYGGLHLIAGVGYITNVAVAPAFRRRGLASRILHQLQAYCTEQHGTELTLEVRPSNSAALALYRKHGFKEAGRRKNYYTNPPEDALLMTLLFAG